MSLNIGGLGSIFSVNQNIGINNDAKIDEQALFDLEDSDKVKNKNNQEKVDYMLFQNEHQRIVYKQNRGEELTDNEKKLLKATTSALNREGSTIPYLSDAYEHNPELATLVLNCYEEGNTSVEKEWDDYLTKMESEKVEEPNIEYYANKTSYHSASSNRIDYTY